MIDDKTIEAAQAAIRFGRPWLSVDEATDIARTALDAAEKVSAEQFKDTGIPDKQLRHIAGEWKNRVFGVMATELLKLRAGLAKGEADRAAPALACARAEGIAAERERIAKWFDDKRIKEIGPDWGLADHDERLDIRDHNRRVMAYAAAIRAGKPEA